MTGGDGAPTSGHRQSSDPSADDIFASPKHRKQQHRGGRKRNRETDSSTSQQQQQQRQPDRSPHRKKKNDREYENGKRGSRQQLREVKLERNPQKKNQSKKTSNRDNSNQNESGSDIFAAPNQHQQKNQQPRQKGQNNNQSKKKKKKKRSDSNQNEPENDIFAPPRQQQQKNEQPIQHGQKKNKSKKKKKQNQSIQNNSGHGPSKKGASKGQKKPKQTPVKKEPKEYRSILEWDSPIESVPLSEEESMVDFMFQRNGKNERGMLKDKPSFVVSKYRKAMHQLAPSMTFPQVLSLRRHHIKLFNQEKNMTQLGLGPFKSINGSARRFEYAIEKFLKESSINFVTEQDQAREAKRKNEILRATPDFLLPKPIVLRKTKTKPGNSGESNEALHVIEERTIHWIEAKMFYGASSIPHGSEGAVGSLLKKTKLYVDMFGEGALLFMMGCGDKLAAELKDIGVTVLDCSGNTVSLDKVHNHQRTWCANEKGDILP